MSPLPEFLTKRQLSEWMGWSAMTIQRKVKQQCFPIYRISYRDVRFKREDILHFIEGKSEGGFNE